MDDFTNQLASELEAVRDCWTTALYTAAAHPDDRRRAGVSLTVCVSLALPQRMTSMYQPDKNWNEGYRLG